MTAEERNNDRTSADTPQLLQRYLELRVPVLTGLSSTYLYRAMREDGADDDDVRGDPQGHFVVLCGYSGWDRTVLVADPLASSPLHGSAHGGDSHGDHK